MPAPLFNELLDDPLLVEAVTDFRGGVSRVVAPQMLPQNAFARATNMALGPSGNLQTRGGTERVTLAPNCTRLLPLALPSVPASLLLAGAATVRHTGYDAPNAFAPVIKTGTFTAPALVQGADKGFVVTAEDVWECDGTALYPLRYLEITLVNKGSGYDSPPAVSFTSAAGAAPVEVASAEATLGATAGFTDKVVAVNVIYGGRGYTAAPTVTFTAPTGSGGVVATATATLRVPPPGAHAVWHTNRLFIADNDTLYVSNFFEPGFFGAANSLRVGGGDGQPITGLKAWDNFNLLVFKRLATYLVTTDPTLSVAQWTVEKVSSTVGCVAGRTAVQVGADVWWLSGQGVVSVRRLAQETQREITSSISAPIRDVMSRINWGTVNTSCAAFHDNKVFFALPLDGVTTPNSLLVFDTLHQAWLDEWTGLAVDDMVTAAGVTTPELLFLAGGRVSRYDTVRITDDAPDAPNPAFDINLASGRYYFQATTAYLSTPNSLILSRTTVVDVVQGARYFWRKEGVNDRALVNASVDAIWYNPLDPRTEILTVTGAFIARSSQVILLGTPGTANAFDRVTATLYWYAPNQSVPIPSSVELRAFSFGDLVTPKTGFNMEVEFTDSYASAQVSLRADEGDFTLVEVLATTGRTVLVLPFNLNPASPPLLVNAGNFTTARLLQGLNGFRYIQPRVAATQGRLSLRSLKLSGFGDTMRLSG